MREIKKKYLFIQMFYILAEDRPRTKEDVEEDVSNCIMGAIEKKGGNLGTVYNYGLINERVHATIYWENDPTDEYPEPPHHEDTEAWLRNIVSPVRDALTQSDKYGNVQFELITQTTLREPIIT